MLNILFVIILNLGCVKISHIDNARQTLSKGQNCLQSLRDNVEPLCNRLDVRQRSNYDIIIRCHKPDENRRNMWDSYYFRLSDPNMSYSDKQKEIVDQHTICLDGGARIEAYKHIEDVVK